MIFNNQEQQNYDQLGHMPFLFIIVYWDLYKTWFSLCDIVSTLGKCGCFHYCMFVYKINLCEILELNIMLLGR